MALLEAETLVEGCPRARCNIDGCSLTRGVPSRRTAWNVEPKVFVFWDLRGLPVGEVPRTPKFSGGQSLASRNRLLLLLARFVETWRGYRVQPRSGGQTDRTFGNEGREIAIAEFAEFYFYALLG